MKKYIPLFLLLVFPKIYGQKQTSVSLLIGPGIDYVNFRSGSQNIINESSLVRTFVLTQQLDSNLYVETGVSVDYIEYIIGRESYNPDIYGDGNYGSGIIFYRNEIKVPLRVQIRQPFFSKKIVAYAMSGINLSIGGNQKLDVSDEQFGVTKYSVNDNFILGQIGVGLDYNLNSHLFAGLAYLYDFGFEKNISIEGYTKNYVPFSLSSRGNSSFFGVHFGYHISNLWNKK